MLCYTPGKHSLGIFFRPSAEPLNFLAQSPVFPSRLSQSDSVRSAKLYVGNVSCQTSEASARALFEPYGHVASVTLITDRDSRRPEGFDFVERGTPEKPKRP